MGLGTAVLLTGCFGGGNNEAEQPAPEGAVTQEVLTCSQECAQNGQCGMAADGRTVVLGNSDRPETREHTLVFPIDVPITILEGRDQLIQPVNAEPYVQPFSHIFVNSDGKQGWVANWCVAQIPVQ